MEKLVSVIIPVYNAEKYIKKCLESIINQTYKKLDIILVDDGSSDNTNKILNEFKKMDKRIRVFTKKNGGSASARNYGLTKVSGDYIVFVDADDYIHKDYISTLYKVSQSEDADLVECDFNIIGSVSNVNSDSTNDINIKTISIKRLNNVEKLNELCERKTYLRSIVLWNKLYKKDLFNGITFVEGKGIDDEFVIHKVIYNAKKIAIIDAKLYYYYLSETSQMRSKPSLKKLDSLEAFEAQMEFFDNNNLINLKEKLYYRYYKKIIDSIVYLKKYFPNEKVKIRELKNKSKKIYRVIFSKNIYLYDKIYLLLCFAFPRTIKKVREIILGKGKVTVDKGDNKKKIGIITIIDRNNYGNRLQNYALQFYLNNLNQHVYTLNNKSFYNIRKNYLISYLYYNIKIFLKKILKNDRINNSSRRKSFNKFDSNINYYKKSDNAYKYLKKFDYLIVGSDQVWNPLFSRLSDLEILKNVEPNKRISYSASFGINELDDGSKKKVKREISNFKSISVREDKGKEFIEELTGRNDVEVLVDPTMLLSSEEWDKISVRPKQLDSIKGEKYILNYFLGNLSESKKNEILRIATENNCKIINILDKNDPFYTCGPSEFLYLEKHAYLICTDSFHSSIFAVIYNRPFIVFDREDETGNMTSRIDTLINKFKLKNRRYDGKKINKENLEHDYKEAYKILENERKKSKEFLIKALDLK